MTVYVDSAFIPAKIGRWNSTWCHMIADTKEELHEFAAKLGLKRSYFQEPKSIFGHEPKPGSYLAESWHYDITASKRKQAIKLGAVEVDFYEFIEVINNRGEI